ncbi:acyl-CoA synthetase (AMP-forming)/AMP-acid ligase II [Duganella sp. 1224]|uniref:class I adenylate-forming enzyme family protein n=1 Tax=Duganella sp. 1224 TaxID=2587052 RepID=UPI0015CDC9CD|nr:AMP-binding protein [Duganella sp. 1224]NYE59630.1 acyl-CoA synthetase (AMP-forming)/AMP-acid ligase II [Duganella sp. 1224]
MNTLNTTRLLAELPSRLSAIPRRWAARTPHAHALHDGTRHWTYAELAAAIDDAAAMLRAWQLRPGDRLAVVGENCVAQVVLSFAAADIDAWIVHINGRLTAREVDAVLAHSGARRAIYLATPASPETAAHATRAANTQLAAVPEAAAHATDAAAPGAASQATGEAAAMSVKTPLGLWLVGPLNADCAPEPVHASGEQQVAALLYTTGTTGNPKGVMLTHRNLLFIAAVSSTLRGLTPADRAYGVLPITHVYGLTSVMLGTLYAGACLYLCPRFTVDGLLAALRDHRLTIVQGVPAMYARLLEKLGTTRLHTHLRFAYAGGSPLPPSLKAQVEQLLGLPLHNGYGLTETSPTVSQTRLDQPRDDTSVGHAIPGIEVRVAAAEDGIGELWVRGPNVMHGYYRDPGLTAAVLTADGWLNTGDMARQADDGALFIVGRTKELIIRSGFNIYPLEVETVLNAHPAVTQSAVVGRPADDGDEQVLAFVELDPRHPVTMEALHQYLRDQLAPYKRPARIIAMDALPAAASGKILKSRLA